MRKGALYAAEPLDRLFVLLNDKRPYPPMALRRQSGPLRSFDVVAGEFVGHLTSLAGLRPDSKVLDVGCGAGALALALRERLSTDGHYIGLDVDRGVIRWCSKHLTDDRFEFLHHDYRNETFNPGGVAGLAWPATDAWADVVLLKSVFTHMLPQDVSFYLEETARVLHRDGVALVTAFLYDEVDDAVTARFPYGVDRYRYARPASPESAIALDARWLLAQLEMAGLRCRVFPGYWRHSTRAPTTFQDLLAISLSEGTLARDRPSTEVGRLRR